ncbi:MAG: hypothetical protein ACHQD6_02020 [Steroidobacterales bacterium]
MTRTIPCLCAAAALLALSALTPVAYADGRDYNDGPVVNVAAIRTAGGHFDEYMHWLATTYKKLMEAQKKAGLITSYRVMVVEPRGPHDPDIYLITEFKNWAALDGLGHKADAVTAEIAGSLEQADHAQAEREKIRTVLGSQTMQVAELK